MQCDAQCTWYPLDSYSNITYSVDNIGVKHADKKAHICPLKDKQIKHHMECSSYCKRTTNKIGIISSYSQNLDNMAKI